ncbi:MAG: acyltransferase [Usitatibacter sp.]
MAAESVPAEAGRIAPLDGLRGVAVAWVVAFHVYALRGKLGDPWVDLMASSPLLEPIVGAGYLGVDLFFLISGFLLALPWFLHASQGRPPPSTRGFYSRRVRRIVPAYYVQLVVLFAVVLPLLRGFEYWRSDLYVYLLNAAAHALFLHNTTPLTSGSMEVNGALWTLAVEAQFYLLLPLLAPLFVRWTYGAVTVAFAAAILWHIGVHDGLDGIVAAEMALGAHWGWPSSVVRYLLLHQLASYLAHFAIGIALGRAWLAWRSWKQPPAKRVLVAMAAAAALLTLLRHVAVDGRLLGEISWTVPPIALGALLFWAVTTPSSLVQGALSRGPLAFLGRVSYSAFLYHVPLLLLWTAYARALPPWLSLPLYLTVLTGVSWLSWRHVEQPFLHAKMVSGTTFRGAESRT